MPLACTSGCSSLSKRIHVKLIEDDHVIYRPQCCDQGGAGALGEDGPARAFQFSRAGIGIDADHEQIAFGPRCLQVTDMADVQQIEHAVGEDDLAAGAAVLVEDAAQSLA